MLRWPSATSAYFISAALPLRCYADARHMPLRAILLLIHFDADALIIDDITLLRSYLILLTLR